MSSSFRLRSFFYLLKGNVTCCRYSALIADGFISVSRHAKFYPPPPPQPPPPRPGQLTITPPPSPRLSTPQLPASFLLLMYGDPRRRDQFFEQIFRPSFSLNSMCFHHFSPAPLLGALIFPFYPSLLSSLICLERKPPFFFF